MSRVRDRRWRVLVIVQNLPVPLDRRVWLEGLALRDAGYGVSVICPKGPADPGYDNIDGIHVYKYRPAPPTKGALSFAVEFVWCWLATAVLSLRVAWRHGFDVIQACNPPDTYWALALLYRPFGVRFVYDQHDLNPELFLSRFGRPRGLVQRLQYGFVRWLEAMTYRTAHHIISTNDSYRRVAMSRGRRRADDVTVVRSGPDTRTMRPVDGLPELRRGCEHLVVYLGIMGPQDGVDNVLAAVDLLVNRYRRRDLHVALLGFGDCLEGLRMQAEMLGLDPYVTFTGRADQRMIEEYLSTACIGLTPDPKTPLNDVSTMNKTLEYMAHALPVVAFDLAETRVSAGNAAGYVEPGDVPGYAELIAELLDDPERRAAMGLIGRQRVVSLFDWADQARAYVGVFDQVTERRTRSSAAFTPPVPADMNHNGTSVWGHRRVNLGDPAELGRFLRTRSVRVPLHLVDGASAWVPGQCGHWAEEEVMLEKDRLSPYRT